MKLNISVGNRKMGAIPSFSLPSGTTCSEEARITCRLDGCYAAAMERRLPRVRETYAENLNLLKTDPEGCRSWLNWYFDNPNAPRLFRIHVSGDFYSCEYLCLWLDVIAGHPGTRFMAFTKQFDIVRDAVTSRRIPENFTLIASAWPGIALPEWVIGRMPVAWMQDGSETRIPEDAYLCDGDCAGACRGHCWGMRNHESVVFGKHGPNVKRILINK